MGHVRGAVAYTSSADVALGVTARDLPGWSSLAIIGVEAINTDCHKQPAPNLTGTRRSPTGRCLATPRGFVSTLSPPDGSGNYTRRGRLYR